jgi:hypothetical protein
MKKKMAKNSAGGGTETGMAGVELLLTAACFLTQDEAPQDQDDLVEDGPLDVVRGLLDEAHSTERVETIMMGIMMQFPMVLRFLEHPNVWVGDTAASCDSSPHKNGMRNIDTTVNGIGIENENGSLSIIASSCSYPQLVLLGEFYQHHVNSAFFFQSGHVDLHLGTTVLPSCSSCFLSLDSNIYFPSS